MKFKAVKNIFDKVVYYESDTKIEVTRDNYYAKYILIKKNVGYYVYKQLGTPCEDRKYIICIEDVYNNYELLYSGCPTIKDSIIFIEEYENDMQG